MPNKFCPNCKQTFTAALLICPHDQAVLSLPDPYQLVGRSLLDKYCIEALVGLGGMGAVYCAYHTGIDRRVAFKILQPNIAVADEHLVELFEREAKVAGRLAHENIVDVKDAGRTPDGTAYIVMEWLEGRTLDDELRAHGALSFARAGEILRQIVAALAEAHAKQVVHRDLKPANVMLVQRTDGREVVKVLDFGIGKILTETGAAVSAVMGTPSYASPEQLQLGGKIDGRSDIYSLGVILYRMLSGRLPFQSGALSELVQMQLMTTPTALRALRPETPVLIDDLVMQMLAKEQQQRPAQVAEVLARYEAALSADDEIGTLNWTTTAATSSGSAAPRPVLGDLPAPHWLRRTEPMPNAPTPRRFEVQANPTAATQVAAPAAAPIALANRKTLLLPGVLLGVALAGGGLALYRYGFDAGASSRNASLLANSALANSPTSTPQTMPTSLAPPKARATIKPKPTPAVQSQAGPPDMRFGMGPPPDERFGPPGGFRGERVPHDAKDLESLPPRERERVNRQIAQQQLMAARQLYDRGLYRGALRACEQALRLDPQNTEALTLQKKIHEALKAMEDR